MKQRLSLKNEERGASLLAVLVVIVVVTAIAVVITKVTLLNVQMKEVERGTKHNFYSAEEIMDELYAGACELSAKAMKTAYVDVMEHYLVYVQQGKDLQKMFSRGYIEELEKTFQDPTVTANVKVDAGSGDKRYSIAEYQTDVLKNCIAEPADQVYFKTEASDHPEYDADYDEGTMTLHQVKVAYTDAQGYETTITTDMVFSTPSLTFSGDSSKEFMNYSLIGNHAIEVNASGVDVGGNVYAGENGITAITSGSGNFTGKVILTRGDIVAESSSSLALGNANSSVWAENIRTEGGGASSLTLNGNCYVADDLTLNGRNSTVTVGGNYYGYNFQKNYATEESALDADFSSAMMVNAKDCKLDLQNINYLMLAGKTFISRGSTSNNDVMLGESLAVRTNQLAYYVPAEYIDPASLRFTVNGLNRFAQSVGITNISDYLNSAQQVVPYYYRDNGVENVYYYLNFASEQKANDYFAIYCNTSKPTTVNGYASNYLSDDAIILDSNRIFTLKGDIMYRTRDGFGNVSQIKEEHVTINAADWSTSGVFWDYASSLAVKYKALQLSLSGNYPGVTADNVRLTVGDDPSAAIDKSVSPMFNHLIDQTAFETGVDADGSADGVGNRVYIPVDKLAEDGTHHQGVILVHNNGDNTYSIPDTYSEGIVVATGNVYVRGNFKGLIISGGKIQFASGVTVDSDKILVAKLFADDMELDDPRFSKYFNDFSGSSSFNKASETVDLKAYLNYENWKKN